MSDDNNQQLKEGLKSTLDKKGLAYAQEFLARNRQPGFERSVVQEWVIERLAKDEAAAKKVSDAASEIANRHLTAAETSAEAANNAFLEAAKANALSESANRLSEMAFAEAAKANLLSSKSLAETTRANRLATLAIIIAISAIVVQMLTK